MAAGRNHLWIMSAALLLLLGGWLMNPAGQVVLRPVREPPAFPKGLKTEEWRRMESRRTLPVSSLPAASAETDVPPSALIRDPLLRALPAAGDGLAVVVEANALRHSELGEILVGCLSKRAAKELEEVRSKYGIDPLEDLDRVAMVDQTMLLSGHFQAAQWEKLFEDAQAEAYGSKARLYHNGVSQEVVGIWNNEMLIFGQTQEQVTAAIDRIEGRAAVETPIPEEMTYGELYGLVDADKLAVLLEGAESGVADKIRHLVENVELHLDASSGVAMSASFHGTDDAGLTDLGKSLGGALALGRMTAQARGDQELADFLQYARVSPRGGAFDLELALPKDVLAAYLKKACDLMGKEDEATGQEGGQQDEPEPVAPGELPDDAPAAGDAVP